MKDHTKICWSCGSKNMKPVETWYQCDDCGATHAPHSKIGSSPLTTVDAETGGAPRARHDTRVRPSGWVTRSAAIARAKAAGTPVMEVPEDEEIAEVVDDEVP